MMASSKRSSIENQRRINISALASASANSNGGIKRVARRHRVAQAQTAHGA